MVVFHCTQTHLVSHDFCQHDGGIFIVWLVLQQQRGVLLACIHLSIDECQARQRQPGSPMLVLVAQTGSVSSLRLQ